MKVCILSMQQIDNIGSLLQSYALKTTIAKLGNEVEFIDIKKRDEDYRLLGNYKQEYHEEREKDGLLGKISKIDRYTINRLKIKRKSVEQGLVFDEFRKEYLNIDKKSRHYDLCVIGSDEVFNCLNSGAWGFTSQLFGNVAEANKVITYAASCGSTKYEELPEKVAEKIRKTFENVSAFSVRDENTHKFVGKLTDKSINDNLDPVLIYNFDYEVEQAALPKMPKHYCVVYSYYNRIHTAEEIDAIKGFCKKYQLTPIAIGAPQFWIKDYIVCSPFQCLKIFKKSDFVITDTFHGTIFASKYADKFAVLARASNKNKLLDLVGKIEMKEHMMSNLSELEEKYNLLNNKEKFDSIIKEETQRTVQYLKNNM
jgi:hypothetical protein